jgi:hypothetical protein
MKEKSMSRKLLVCSLLLAVIATVSISSGSNASAQGQTTPLVQNLDDYEGFVDLKTPSGGIVPFWWYINFGSNSHMSLNASGAISSGSWFQVSPSSRLCVIRNAPYFTVFVVERQPFSQNGANPDYVVTYFSDSWGNSVASSALWTFEN